MRTFEHRDAGPGKFWRIDLQGSSFTVTFGRIGTAGQTQTKSFPDETKARAAHDKLIAEKLAKGYAEKAAAAAPSATQLALERALVESPDDLATHAAYADYLMEQGDPRGELIQVQLALEDPRRPAGERKDLQKREKELLRRHEEEWLGDLAPFLVRQKHHIYQFARGWLDSLHIAEIRDVDDPLPRYTRRFFSAVAGTPQAWLLRRLILDADELPWQEEGEEDAWLDWDNVLELLRRSPYLGNVRVFQLGPTVDVNEDSFNTHVYCDSLHELVRTMPRLEELYLPARCDLEELFGLKSLTCLRVLQVCHNRGRHPLETLARNRALGRLTSLWLTPAALASRDDPYIDLAGVRALVRSPHLKSLTHLRLRSSDMGDEGCEEIVRSGILRRLKLLDLRHGVITDRGAEVLAACPELRNLEHLDLHNNALTQTGVRALNAVGIRVRTDGQRDPAYGHAFTEGDVE
jgi:uncharacterized protein (TIGR02996 family)